MKLLFSISSFLVPTILLACNSCGCFIGSGIGGLNLQNNKYMVRYNSQFRNFHTSHPADDVYVLDRQTKEQFWGHSLELTRMVKPWLLASVGLNAAHNTFQEKGVTTRFSGLSSIALGLSFQKMMKSYESGNNVYALARLNYAQPVGSNKDNAENKNFSEALYPSTGAHAFSGALQLLYNRKKTVYYGQVNLAVNGETPSNYRFGTAINFAIGMAADAFQIKNSNTIVAGLESAIYHSYANQYLGKKLSDNNGSYLVLMPQAGIKTEKLSVLLRKAVVLHQNIGSGNTQLKNQIELNLTIKI
jgi:hypothetical protein